MYDFNELYSIGAEYCDKEQSSKKQQNLEELIERIERYPCCMSCYLTVEEMQAAKSMKESILQILKGEK